MSIETIAENLYVAQTLRRVAQEVFDGNEKQNHFEGILDRIYTELMAKEPPLLKPN